MVTRNSAKKANATRKRKAPAESATAFPEGTIRGNWVIKKASNGVPRWMINTSVELNGFRLFTVDYATAHVGKPIRLYCREYKDKWPSKNAWAKPEDSTYTQYLFVPNGDAVKGKTKQEGWLRSRNPAIKPGSHFLLDGPVYECKGKRCDEYLANGTQVDSLFGKLVSVDLMGTETFVKV